MNAIDLNVAFEVLFAQEQLLEQFHRRHIDSRSRGLDRHDGKSFAAVVDFELTIASKKCLSGEYKFTPYLEGLKVKDRFSPPRLISIPTIRDRVVLGQLNKVIKLTYPNESRTHLATEVVNRLSETVKSLDLDVTWTSGRDIKTFYDSINRTKLQKIIASKADRRAVALVYRAINTPTVPKTYRAIDKNKYRQEIGIPQGLPISNSLAAIYLYGVDEPMRQMPIDYFRFVDDVLLIGSETETAKAARSFAARIRARGLAIHKTGPKKGHHSPISIPFSYLGYIFDKSKVTVRESTVERLLQSLASKITDYKHNSERILQRKQFLTKDSLRDAFIDELNERISGAISGKRRYGWIAYFSQITDHSILFRIDAAIKSIFLRVGDLAPHAGSLKRFGRAIFEIRFRPNDGYVRNYDKFETHIQMLNFLVFRGEVDGAVALTAEQIIARFEAYKERQLTAMLADEAAMY